MTARLFRTCALSLTLLVAACGGAATSSSNVRIVVMPIDGSDEANDAVHDTVKKRYELVSPKKYARVARKLDAKSRADEDIAAVSERLDVDALVDGKIVKKGKRKYVLLLSLRSGASGEEFETIEIKLRSRDLSKKDRKRINGKLLSALSEVDEWAAEEERSSRSRRRDEMSEKERKRSRRMRRERQEREQREDEKRLSREDRDRDRRRDKEDEERLSRRERKRLAKREKAERREREREAEEREEREERESKRERAERERRDREIEKKEREERLAAKKKDDKERARREKEEERERAAREKKEREKRLAEKKKKELEEYKVVIKKDSSGQAMDDESPF